MFISDNIFQILFSKTKSNDGQIHMGFSRSCQAIYMV